LQNFSQALYWFEKSAGQGNSEAQIHLGDAYARGKGVSVDLVKAHMWLSLAATKGGYEAKFRLQYLLSQMSPEQIAEAQRARQD
ncbi:MAG: tetratricopeptide repeat protein, partial [Anderseniella sp.]